MSAYPLVTADLVLAMASAQQPHRRGTDIAILRAATTHRIWLESTQHQQDALAVALPLDQLFEYRIAAVRRLWRAMKGLPPGDDPHPLTPYAKGNLIRVLRLIDARHAGASEREMAQIILGVTPARRRDWASSNDRTKLRRLLAKGRSLLDGGYYDILCPRPRRPRRRQN